MIRLTKQEKIKVLEYAKQILIDLGNNPNRTGFGMCYAIDYGLIEIDNPINDYGEIDEIFPLFKSFEPKNHGLYWFPITDIDSRIEILNALIENEKK